MSYPKNASSKPKRGRASGESTIFWTATVFFRLRTCQFLILRAPALQKTGCCCAKDALKNAITDLFGWQVDPVNIERQAIGQDWKNEKRKLSKLRPLCVIEGPAW